MRQIKKEHLLIVILTGFLLLAGGLCFAMCIMTKYPLYFCVSMGSVFFGATNLLLLLLKIGSKVSMSGKKEVLRKMACIFCFIGYGLLVIVSCYVSIRYLQQMETVVYPAVSNIVVFLMLFVAAEIFEKICHYVKGNTTFERSMIQNNRNFMKFLVLESLLSTIGTLLEAKRLFAIQRYLGWVFTVLWFYYVGCILLSMAVNTIRKVFINEPYFNIPLPSLKKDGEESEKAVGFITYLETNTGISMRSLWSVKYLRQIAPFAVVLTGLFLWLSTCIVQVEAYQQAAVWRLGVLQEETLKQGIHFTLPYPFDKVEIYDTEVLNKMTIGFRSESSSDNLWTSSHQGEEYKLLLGSRDEVVSVNLRLEYRISDLLTYLSSSTTPEAILQASAYELVTDRTIHTDLHTFLSTDREVFSQSFLEELKQTLQEKELGLEVVSVVLESIHPPKEIAEVYQQAVSAEIDAQAIRLEAESRAVSDLAEADISYQEAIGLAHSDSEQKIAEAKSSVAEFLASVEANRSYGDAYKYQKYLRALKEAYGKANLVIVSEGIDQSAIYFGNFSAKEKDSDDRVLGDEKNDKNKEKE